MKQFILFSLILIAGCSPTDEELWLKIEQAKANSNWDSTMIVSQRILHEYPNGRFAGWARFALGESFRFKNQPREALDQYIIFVGKYSDLQPAPVSLFLIGYIYGNNLQNYDSAKYYFEKFLDKYPMHDLAPSVRLELETLGKSPQEALQAQTEKNRPIARQ